MSSQPITTPYNLSELTPQQLQVEATISRNKIRKLGKKMVAEDNRLTEIEALLIEHHTERRAGG